MHESEFHPHSETAPTQPPSVMFFSGSLGTDKGIRNLKKSIEEQYGTGNVYAYNSALSFDAPNPQRFEDMAATIKRILQKGGELKVVAHSLGASEFDEARSLIEKEEPDFFARPEVVNKLQVTLISPSGFFEGTRGGFRMLGRAAQFMHEQTAFPVIATKKSELRGIDTLNAFIPKVNGEPLASEEVAEGVREALGPRSHYEEGTKTIPYVPVEDNTSYLPQEVQEKLQVYDEILQAVLEYRDLEGNRNHEGIKHILASRNKLLSPYLEQVWSGDLGALEEDATAPFQWSGPAMLGLLRLLGNMFQGKTMEHMGELRQKGVPITLLVPEYDIYLPLQEAKQFFEGDSQEAEERLRLLEMQTHTSFALRPSSIKSQL